LLETLSMRCGNNFFEHPSPVLVKG
jgi:hypothetical protein